MSSVNSYCTIILEYLVVRDVNIISVKLRCLHPASLNIPVADGVIKFGDYQFSLKFWAGDKINRPGQLAPHPLSIHNPTEPLK